MVRRKGVIDSVRHAIEANVQIKLPPFDPQFSQRSDAAVASVALEPNSFGGRVGIYRYQFEGEEDLLHLIVSRLDGSVLSAEEGQAVASFLLPGLAAGLVWIRPGEFSQHFYCGHDDLVTHVLS